MKRFLSIAVFLVSVPAFAEVALVYKSGADVSKMIFSPALATSQGIAVSATGLLAAGDGLMVGIQGQELKKASIIRFDNDLNLALLRVGDRVSEPALQKAHERNSQKMSLFLPELGQLPSGVQSTISTAPIRTERFLVFFNGMEIGKDPIVLQKYRKKATMSIKVQGENIDPQWRVKLIVEATPKLGFWKKGDDRGLNAIPASSLTYSHQILFVPFGKGRTLEIPVEISYIKEENYEFVVKVESKAGPFEIKVPVRFEEKK